MRYLFFDIECANCFDGKGKICSFGYCIVDKNFKVLAQKDILINPRSRFHLGPTNKDEGIKLSYPQSAFRAAPDFKYYYEIIKGLLTSKDQIVFGHAVYNDLSFIRSDCDRYKKEKFDIKAYDTQALYKQISQEGSEVGLDRLCDKYEIEKEHLHRSDYDAYLTMRVLQALCKEQNMTIDEMVINHINAYVEMKDGVITKEFCPPTNTKLITEYAKKISVEKKYKMVELCTKTFGFDDDLENSDIKLCKKLAYAIKKRGGQFTNKPKRMYYYVQVNENSIKSQKIKKGMENGQEVEILTVDELKDLIKFDEITIKEEKL